VIECALALCLTVTDGDTVRLGDERIRIENIDAPETGQRAECDAERLLGQLATAYARALIDTDGVQITRHGKDRYGRTLALITINENDFGELMIAGGYAAPWKGRQHDWCKTE